MPESDRQHLSHPCFDHAAHYRVGRIHLPVAPRCNAVCGYCRRAISRSIDRPGVTASILSPIEALERAKQAISADPAIEVIGIAGPGDALANEATFETLALVNQDLPHLQTCLSTNGLLLPGRIDDLCSLGVDSITVTVNAIDPCIGKHFYKSVIVDGLAYREDAFSELSERQLKGIEMAAERGIMVKVNSVLVPALNGDHLADVAENIAARGATLMNIMPLRPLSAMAAYDPPDCLELELARARCELIIPQFKLCRQCRADAVGIPGKAGEDHALARLHL